MNIRGIQIQGMHMRTLGDVHYVMNIKSITIDSDLGSLVVRKEDVERMLQQIKASSEGRITSIDDLRKAAQERKSVVCPGSYSYRKPSPAAWMLNFNAGLLATLMSGGMMIYKPKGKPRKCKNVMKAGKCPLGFKSKIVCGYADEATDLCKHTDVTTVSRTTRWWK